MPDEHERLELAAYALGLLDVAERAGIEAHLVTCADCTDELRGYRDVTEMLPQALTAESPPKEAWDSIIARIRGRRPSEARRRRWLHWPARGRVLQPALLGILAVAVVGLAVWNGVLQYQLSGSGDHDDSGNITVYLGATGPNSKARGQLRMTPDQQLGGLVVRDLPPLPAGSSYAVWFVRPDQSRVSGGTFPVDALGQAIVEVSVPQPVGQFDGVGISPEPAGASSTPTTGDVLAGIIYDE